MTQARIVAEVAEAVGLAEGEGGVRDVLRAVARLEPVAVRKLSRTTELPVPFVAAICNELRKHGVVSRERPVRLTPQGRDLFAPASRRPLHAACPTCARREVVIPPALTGAVRRMATLAKEAPAPRVEIDQVHCTVETKIRRVLALDEAGALDGRRILLLGDDDLTSVAIDLVAYRARAGAAIEDMVVLDVDPAVVAFARRALRGSRFPVECLVHDLRDPLPARLCGSVDTVLTDPPYTSEGAALFLSRAAEATGGRPGRDVFLSFGPSRPEIALRVQRSIAEMGFTVRRLIRNFNDYVGAGVLGGTSHLYQLGTTTELRGLVHGRYDGPLYTGDFRTPSRTYRCKECGRLLRVGRGKSWKTVEALRRDRCPGCSGEKFIPLPRHA